MTPAFPLAFSVGLVVLLAVLMSLMPAITPRTVPLGVAVPPSRIGDPVVRRAVARYRIGQLVAAVIAIAVAVALLAGPPAARILVPTFVFLVLSVGVLLVCRRGIIAAKRADDWYAGVSVQQSAEVTAPTHHHPPVVWGVVALVALAVGFAIGAAVYPGLPARLPVHFDFAGHPDAYAAKSVWSVFGILLIGLGLSVLLFVVAAVVPRTALRSTPGDDPQGALDRAAARRGVLAAMLAQLSAVIAVSLSFIGALIWLTPPPVSTITGLVVTIVLIFVVLGVALVRYRRIARPAPTVAAGRPGPAAPDDDRYWKGGIFYVNRDDPALWVPRRFGMGWTINLGRPAGIVVSVAIIVVIVAVVLTLIVTTAHGR